jgi:hypothetical protein
VLVTRHSITEGWKGTSRLAISSVIFAAFGVSAVEMFVGFTVWTTVWMALNSLKAKELAERVGFEADFKR